MTNNQLWNLSLSASVRCNWP